MIMNTLKLFSLCGILALYILACSGKKAEEKSSAEPQIFQNYELNNPSVVFVLPEELNEISGLAVISPELLLANQDEKGVLYFFNIEKETVEKKLKWGKEGDYEGVAVVGNTAYVTNSKGTIYQIKNYQSGNPEVKEFENKELSDCDAEGLAYHKDEHVLLIACKEGSGKGDRKIYRFSPDSMVLEPQPYRSLSLKEIEEFVITTGLDKFSVNLGKFLDPEGESGVLLPSGIAIHPKSKDLFVLSAKSKLLLVYTPAGELKDVAELDHTLFRQPEAIAFTPNGDLYIGNEAKGEKATILKFVYAQK